MQREVVVSVEIASVLPDSSVPKKTQVKVVADVSKLSELPWNILCGNFIKNELDRDEKRERVSVSVEAPDVVHPGELIRHKIVVEAEGPALWALPWSMMCARLVKDALSRGSNWGL